MDRRIVFTYEVPYSQDFLYENRFTMIALGKIIEALVATDTALHGLNCIPTTPASLNVEVEPGEIYKLEAIDTVAYGSIPADAREIMKQGLVWDNTELACPAPVNPGNAVKHLVQVTYDEEDTDAFSRQFFDGTNPPYVQTKEQTRLGKCIITLKQGVEAPSGTEVVPTPDSGYVGAWVVRVVYAQTQITSGDITEYSGAPFIPATVFDYATKQQVQKNTFNFGVTTGTANTYTVVLSPAITAYTDGLVVYGKINVTNDGASTLDAGAGAKQIVDLDGSAVSGGELAANGIYHFVYNITIDKWVVQNAAQTSGFSTGFITAAIWATAPVGWVKMDDGTIGDASSGGTTRANNDTEGLFTLLWNQISDSWCPVSGGRGASAAVDFAAHKTITLPRALGRVLASAGAGSGLTSRALGEFLGEETHQQAEAELAQHVHPPYPGWEHIPMWNPGGGSEWNGGGFGGLLPSTGSTGNSTPFNVMQPSIFLNFFMKL